MIKKAASARRPLAKVSRKDSILLFKQLKNRPVAKSKAFLEQLVSRRKNIGGRYYPKLSQEIIALLKDAEKNAEAKGMDPERLFVKTAKVSKIFKFYLPKSRFSHRGKIAKICDLNVEVEER